MADSIKAPLEQILDEILIDCSKVMEKPQILIPSKIVPLSVENIDENLAHTIMHPTNIEKLNFLPEKKSPRDFVVRVVHAQTPFLKQDSSLSEGDFEDYLNSGGQK